MISREDLMRELELLPVWQLRNAVVKATVEVATTVESVAVESVAVASVVQSEVATYEVETQQATHQFRLIVSEDAQWAFVLEQQQNSEAELLLQNMLKAVEVKVGQAFADANKEHLSQHVSKVIVVMGEVEAQQLLNETQTLEQMRSKPHQYQDTPVIATYSPSHLLLNLADKAKAWEDLCLSKFTVTSL